jgi:dihydrofolate synthase/folylpolyglutamate synthase
MTYEEALHYIKDCTKFGVKLGLERMRAILERAGHPERRFRAIHVAGTNGKGSTTAMFDAVLREAGYTTGRFNSPHLVSYRERFLVNGVMITKARLAAIITELEPVLASVLADGYGAPTEFEVGTALAFLFFAREPVDLAIVEVGMGGRFDATNVLQPMLSVITHIALDHQEYLGSTLEKIAFEKAGIIKAGVPVVIGLQEAEIAGFLRGIAAERDSIWTDASQYRVTDVKSDETGTCFTTVSPVYGELGVTLSLLGGHQVQNCLNVLAGLEVLYRQGLKITRENVLRGLAGTVWPGRFERIPAVGPMKFFFDGAHNPDGIRALVDGIKRIFPGRRVDFLVGILNNRPLKEMAAILAEIARKVIVTTVPDPKSATVEDLAAAFRSCGISAVREADPAAALQLLLETDNEIAVATGSFYLTGWLRSILLKTED